MRPPAGRVPPSGDSFVGREPELQAIEDAYDHGQWLVTIVGTGGIGKTRLALEHLARRSRRPATGESLNFVGLSQVRSLDALVAEVAQALDVTLSPERPSIEQLGYALASLGPVLLVLDNLEQVIDEAAAAISVWRGLAPRTRFLATSRIALGLGGEQRIAVPPLTAEESCALFRARARAVRYQFEVGDEQRSSLRRLVERLGGIPLAIELAAARVGSMALDSLCERVEASLSLLRSTRRDVAPRQATLTATIEWSWELLSFTEQRALAKCGIFRGDFSLAAAEAVLEPSSGEAEAIDTLHALCEKSLLRRSGAHDETRFRLDEPIREFAEARLQGTAARAAMSRHAAYYLRVAEPLTDMGALYGTCGLEALQRASRNLDNLFAAMQRTAASEPATCARIGLALANLLHLRGPRSRCLRTVEAALAGAVRAEDDALECRLLILLAASRRQWDDSGDPEPSLIRARHLARSLGDRSLEAFALYHHGMVHLDRAQLDAARERLCRALQIQEEVGDPFGLGLILDGLALLHTRAGAYDEAIALHGRAIEASRRAGNRRSEAISLRNRAFIYHELGDPERALRDSQRALEIQAALRDPHGTVTLVNLIEMAAQVGDLALARSYAAEALPRARSGETTPRLGDPFLATAYVHLLEGEAAQAEQLLDEGVAWHEQFSNPRLHAPALIGRGIVRLLRSRPAAARLDLEDALALCATLGPTVTDASLAAGFLAVVELVCGRPAHAWPRFAQARQEAARWRTARFDRTLRVLERCFTPAARLDDASAWPRYAFLEEAAAQALLERLASIATRRADICAIGPNNSWIQPSGGPRIDLRRRPVLQRVVAALVEARRTRPGEPTSTRALVDRVWPGDRSDRAALENRLWVAISAARKLGLDGLLVTEPGGYMLDPRVPLVDAPPAHPVRRAG